MTLFTEQKRSLMANYRLEDDLLQLTSLSHAEITRLTDLVISLIASAVADDSDAVTSVDMVFGILHISKNDDGIRYKFVPNKNFEKVLVGAVVSKDLPIVAKLEDALGKELIRSYYDLL